jgi:hypothetical protein
MTAGSTVPGDIDIRQNIVTNRRSECTKYGGGGNCANFAAKAILIFAKFIRRGGVVAQLAENK